MKRLSIGAVAVLVCAAAAQAQAQPEATFKTNLAWQIALDRSGFSGGVIDGKIGPKTQLATREYQRAHGIAVAGQLDAATSASLGVLPAASAVTTYTIRPQDSDEVGPAPRSWLEKSKLPALKYEGLATLVGEKFHCSQSCLAALNPGKNLGALKAGDTLSVPNAATDGPIARGARIEISFSEKVVRVKDDSNHLVGMFCCSIAKDRENLPTVRSTSVAVITPNPQYRFDPEMWPEVKDVHHVLLIPAGPRNPVGLCWMGLALKGYGMHGTPAPDMIGKTGSHGCFRLTNWDAVRLSKMISVGTPVAFLAGSGEARSVAGISPTISPELAGTPTFPVTAGMQPLRRAPSAAGTGSSSSSSSSSGTRTLTATGSRTPSSPAGFD